MWMEYCTRYPRRRDWCVFGYDVHGVHIVATLLLFVVVIITVGETAIVIFLLHGIFTSSNFLGYSLSVYTIFKLRLGGSSWLSC
jgi:hypothetical protein